MPKDTPLCCTQTFQTTGRHKKDKDDSLSEPTDKMPYCLSIYNIHGKTLKGRAETCSGDTQDQSGRWAHTSMSALSVCFPKEYSVDTVGMAPPFIRLSDFLCPTSASSSISPFPYKTHSLLFLVTYIELCTPSWHTISMPDILISYASSLRPFLLVPRLVIDRIKMNTFAISCFNPPWRWQQQLSSKALL